jgi:hypothetical protein
MPRTELNCRRHEDATLWLSRLDPGDGRGLVGDEAADPLAMFTQPVVIQAFIAGAEWSDDENEAEFAIERATGQRQLDEAGALMREAAALFMGYYEHHKNRAAEFGRQGDVDAEAASLRKAHTNLSMAVSLKEWLSPDRVPGEDVVICHAGVTSREQAERMSDWRRRTRPGWWDKACGIDRFPIPAVITEAGDIVPVDDKTVVDCRERFANRPGYGEPSNVRLPSVAGLRDPVVVEGLMAAAGLIDATDPISLATATAFRLQTPDPRFNPSEPVVVNGFLYHPATEALCKTN